MLKALKAAGPLDALFLSIHGAAASEHEDDVEGALLENVRFARPAWGLEPAGQG
jgi:microcystin degradation protein MlrC